MATRPNGRRRRILERELADLYPGSFALVMATGIVSIAAFLLAMETVAWALLLVNAVAYGVLWILTLFRAIRYPTRLAADFTDHGRGAGFFTAVAATCVLGSQLGILAGALAPATILWGLGALLWGIVSYAFFAAVAVRRSKPGLEGGINGTWLLAVVATQSVSILGTQVAPRLGGWQEAVLFFAVALYLFGCLLYLLLISLIFYRLTFFRLTPEDLTPPAWITMGAAAITTLAGATLLLAAPQSTFLGTMSPVLRGLNLVFWGTATWWIPLLLILGIWRHGYHRVPLTYTPQYWALVFPLGMYSAGTFQVARTTGLAFLFPVSRYAGYIALFAWGLTVLGLVRSLVSDLAIASPAAGRIRD